MDTWRQTKIPKTTKTEDPETRKRPKTKKKSETEKVNKYCLFLEDIQKIKGSLNKGKGS
jgi:hypothetical protein